MVMFGLMFTMLAGSLLYTLTMPPALKKKRAGNSNRFKIKDDNTIQHPGAKPYV
jgi:hypothetical protein